MEQQMTEREYIISRYAQQGDFNIFEDALVAKMVDSVLALNEEYMEKAGISEGNFYDDDAAFDYFMEKLPTLYPEQKMYLMRFIEDFMEYDEAYLESTGAIDWE